MGKPDLAPAAWVRRLVTLCDQAPATPFEAVQYVLEKEFGCEISDIFERFDENPIGSASIAQVLSLYRSLFFFSGTGADDAMIVELGAPSEVERREERCRCQGKGIQLTGYFFFYRILYLIGVYMNE